jgi:hypothetical protein
MTLKENILLVLICTFVVFYCCGVLFGEEVDLLAVMNSEKAMTTVTDDAETDKEKGAPAWANLGGAIVLVLATMVLLLVIFAIREFWNAPLIDDLDPDEVKLHLYLEENKGEKTYRETLKRHAVMESFRKKSRRRGTKSG